MRDTNQRSPAVAHVERGALPSARAVGHRSTRNRVVSLLPDRCPALPRESAERRGDRARERDAATGLSTASGTGVRCRWRARSGLGAESDDEERHGSRRHERQPCCRRWTHKLRHAVLQRPIQSNQDKHPQHQRLRRLRYTGFAEVQRPRRLRPWRRYMPRDVGIRARTPSSVTFHTFKLGQTVARIGQTRSKLVKAESYIDQKASCRSRAPSRLRGRFGVVSRGRGAGEGGRKRPPRHPHQGLATVRRTTAVKEEPWTCWNCSARP